MSIDILKHPGVYFFLEDYCYRLSKGYILCFLNSSKTKIKLMTGTQFTFRLHRKQNSDQNLVVCTSFFKRLLWLDHWHKTMKLFISSDVNFFGFHASLRRYASECYGAKTTFWGLLLEYKEKAVTGWGGTHLETRDLNGR